MTSTKLLTTLSAIAIVATFSTQANAGGCTVEVKNPNSEACPAICTGAPLHCGDIRDNKECVANIKKQFEIFKSTRAQSCDGCDIVANCQVSNK